ncbi:GNAT family N-acetyltransferase [Duganella qianjiadongensis]|uniref:GNAT family N-acetyltransferase n=1 Tax=Duganella qianjiadongensis TaxID=2692176 RepID=A0ABW9VHA3_9BURK|nr:GNAT family N-acetyltransferase [Duganella qianjiadongensis]MYM39004.1 GNAT family N-acetyltransferase [Duganella qianjiadongensis]
MEYTLHPPSPQHFATLGDWISDAEQCLRWAGPKLAFPFDPAVLQSLLETEPMDSYALLDQHASLAGFGQIFRREPGTGHLGRIIIDPRRRQQGIGQILCSELIRAGVQRQGFRAMTLWVYLDNAPAVQLYSALGFVAEAREGAAGCQFMRLQMAA